MKNYSNSQTTWRLGLKIFIFNLCAFLIVFSIGKIMTYFTSNSWFYFLLILFGGGISIPYWVTQARQWSGSKGGKFIVSLIGSGFYWLLALLAVGGLIITNDFLQAGGLFLIEIVMGYTAIICMLVITFSPSKK